MNHINSSNSSENLDTLEKHVFCNRIFAKALTFLLQQKDGKNEGIVVDIDDQKFIVHTGENQIKVSAFEEDIPEGTFVWFHVEEKDDIIKTEEYKEFCKNNGFDPESENGIQDFLSNKWLPDANPETIIKNQESA